LAEYERIMAGPKTDADLARAIQLQPNRAEPHLLLATREPDLPKRVDRLKTAIALDRRDGRAWRSLAEAYEGLSNWGEAGKAWRAAEQAAATPAERAAAAAGRGAIEQKRLDWEEAERRRIAEEKEREIRKLKEQAVAELRALEKKHSGEPTPRKPGEEIVAWWDGPRPDGKVRGTLKQVDCLGRLARLVIEGDHRAVTRVVVRDPAKIAIVGAREQALGCGPQKGRPIVVEYFKKPDAKLNSAGDVATIEFP
jgi:tetratricopeptide (TPR) repeat protein